MMIWSRLCGCVLAMALWGPVAFAQAADTPVQTVAFVNDAPVTAEDLRERMTLLAVLSGAQIDDQTLAWLRPFALQGLIDDRLKTQEAAAQGIGDVEAAVDERIELVADMRDQRAEDLVAELVRVGVTEQAFRNYLRPKLAWEALIADRYGGRVIVTDAQVAAALALLDTSDSPRVRVLQIFLGDVRSGGHDSALAMARQLSRSLSTPEQFNFAAVLLNQGRFAAYVAGDWVAAADLPEDLRGLAAASPNRVSGPYETDGGVWLYFVADRWDPDRHDLRHAMIELPVAASNREVDQARMEMDAFKARAHCTNFESWAQQFNLGSRSHVMAADMGEVSGRDLLPEFQTAIATLTYGDFSPMFRNGSGLHLMMLCDNLVPLRPVVDRAQIETQMIEQRRVALEARHLRDLHRDALIEMRDNAAEAR